MGNIDRQRIAAVRTLGALGYTYRDGEGWRAPDRSAQWREADALHALLVDRADQITKHHVGLREMQEFRAITKALEAYEAKRWPGGNERGGKG